MSDQPFPEFVERYANLRIMREATADGGAYFAVNGTDFAADGAETVEEARSQIDDYWLETQHGEANAFFAGTAK